MYRTIRLHFPELFDWMRKVDDCRKKASNYELAAHLTACLAMFLFKSGSRNQYNQHREDSQFQKNYKRLFGFAMPHGSNSEHYENPTERTLTFLCRTHASLSFLARVRSVSLSRWVSCVVS